MVKSKISSVCGLSVSLLERVMHHQPYARHALKFQQTGYYDPNLVSTLPGEGGGGGRGVQQAEGGPELSVSSSCILQSDTLRCFLFLHYKVVIF